MPKGTSRDEVMYSSDSVRDDTEDIVKNDRAGIKERKGKEGKKRKRR